jgi:hypothetical protein
MKVVETNRRTASEQAGGYTELLQSISMFVSNNTMPSLPGKTILRQHGTAEIELRRKLMVGRCIMRDVKCESNSAFRVI